MANTKELLDDINILSEPPICDCCDRYVKMTYIKPLMSTTAATCRDCQYGWYETLSVNKDEIKAYVLGKYGATGGEGVDWPTDELERLRKKSANQDKIIQDLYGRLKQIGEVLA